MVAVDDGGGVFERALGIEGGEADEILVVVVGDAGAVLVDAAAQDAVGEVVATRLHVAAAVQKAVPRLRRLHRVEHDGEVAAGRVLHADGDVHAAGGEAMLLVFDRARADRLVGEEVVEVAAVFGIEHLVGGGEAALAHGADVHLADGDDAVQQVGRLVGAGLVQHPLVARARRARLVGVDARDDDEPFGELLLQGHEAGDVLADGIFVICRAGPDDDDEFIRLAREHVADGGVARGLDGGKLRREGELRLEFVRRGERRVLPHRHLLISP